MKGEKVTNRVPFRYGQLFADEIAQIHDRSLFHGGSVTMKYSWTRRSLQLFPALLVVTGGVAGVCASWPQWGGPNGDFKVSAARMAEQWPADGPKKLWERALGDGFSSVVADSDGLYTMYGTGDEEVIIALEANTGKPLWEHRYAAPLHKGKRNGYLGNDSAFAGRGPRATPLLVGDRLYTIGYTAILHCLEKKSGKVFWSCDLIRELEGWIHECGYSASPLAYRDTVILLLGSREHGVVAFDQKTGAIVWKSFPFAISKQESQGFQATPLVITLEGEDQFVFMSPTEVIGIDPKDGRQKWSHPHQNQFQYNCVTPLGGNDGLLYVTSHSHGGSRGLQLNRKEGKTVVRELWHNSRIGLYHNNGICLEDYVYGCNGPFSYAQNVKTGEVAWKERGFSEANLLYADGKIIILDEKGVLALATVSPQQLTVHAKFQLFREEEGESWTPPTLVGSTLYARNRHRIVALELR